MTSIIGIPATYTCQRSHAGLFSAYIENVLLGQYWSLEEAKWNAKRHYLQQVENNPCAS